jgi:hypothetical protein
LRFEQTEGGTEEKRERKRFERERERERGIAEEDTCRGDRCTYMYVCTVAAAQVLGVNCLLHRSRTGKFAMAGCSKSFMNLIGGTCSSSDHHQTRQDEIWRRNSSSKKTPPHQSCRREEKKHET